MSCGLTIRQASRVRELHQTLPYKSASGTPNRACSIICPEQFQLFHHRVSCGSLAKGCCKSHRLFSVISVTTNVKLSLISPTIFLVFLYLIDYID